MKRTKRFALARSALVVLLLALCLMPPLAHGQQSPATTPPNQQQMTPIAPAASPQAATPQEAQRTVTTYTLPPDLYQKARNLSKIRSLFALISFVYGLMVLWLVLRWRLAPKYRTWVEGVSSKRFVQGILFAPLLILTIDILSLPTEIYDNWVDREYGLSVQGWRSWSWDWVKGQLISVIIGTILVLILYAVIRKSPRLWWFYFWLVSVAFLVLGAFLQPLIVDPLFHKFVPLQQKNPALTASLEQMVQRAGVNIPPERMFWMGASEKSTALNAYVIGIGASKRIVVWDTTIAKMDIPQIVFVAGHETGHYVLHHIPKFIALDAFAFLILFYLGYRLIDFVLATWGGKWDIRGVEDWASLPALILLLTVLSFIAGPVTSATSRHYEHQADQYGLEVTHALTPDSAQVAAQAFQILGEVDLSDPEPNPVNVFLFYSHPPIPDRIRFALTYDPWANGRQGEFVH